VTSRSSKEKKDPDNRLTKKDDYVAFERGFIAEGEGEFLADSGWTKIRWPHDRGVRKKKKISRRGKERRGVRGGVC